MPITKSDRIKQTDPNYKDKINRSVVERLSRQPKYINSRLQGWDGTRWQNIEVYENADGNYIFPMQAYNGTNYHPPRIDTATRAINTIEYEHYEIHSGSSFTCSYQNEVAGSENLDLLIVTPAGTKWAHLVYEVDVEAETQVYIYEAVTATAAANPVVAYNRDRNNTIKTPTVVVTHTPTDITEGSTIIRSYHLGSGKAFGGGARGVHEFILKAGTKYLFRLTNLTVSDNWMSVIIDWYEHTNKDA